MPVRFNDLPNAKETGANAYGANRYGAKRTERADNHITIENLPGIDAPVILDGDTVYTDVDTPPVFSAGNLGDYLQEAVKDIHIGKGISLVSFVVSKAGYPYQVFLRRSAGMRVTDTRIAAQMDSIACEIVRDLPSFLPATLNGELVNYRMAVAVRFK